MDELRRLHNRIDALEKELGSIRRDAERLSSDPSARHNPEVSPGHAGGPETVPVSHAAHAADTRSPAPDRPATDRREPTSPVTGLKRFARTWEFTLAGNLLGKLGLLALILATAWFVKLAFDEQWINESGRIYTGMLGGFLTISGGLVLAHRSYRILPPAIVGAGSAMLYIAIWGAHRYYDLIGFEEAFLFLVVLAAATAVVSYAGRSQVLYAFSLAGSLLAPVLLSRGENSYRFLFAYLTIVNVGFLLLSTRYAWRVAPWLLFAASAGLFAIWAAEHIEKSGFAVPYSFVLILFLFTAGRQLILVPRTASTFRKDEALLVVAAGIFACLASFWLFDTHFASLRPHGLLVIACFIAALFFVTDRWLLAHPHRLRAKGILAEPQFLLRTTTFVLFLPTVFAALTDFADGSYGTAAWIAFAGAIGTAGSLRRSRVLVAVSLLAWLPALARLFADQARPEAFLPVWNTRFALHLLATTLLATVYVLQRKRPIHGWMSGFVYAAMATFILGALRDNHDLFADPHYRNLGYSYVLALHAAIFLAAGFALSLVSWRRAGLALAAVVVLKLYLYDIWTMGRAVRIIAGFSLGASLVALSILYNRFRSRLFPEEKQP